MMAVILSGGYGKRLRPLTEKIPKSLIEINGKPIIVHQIEWLKNQGINRFLILAGYLADKIVELLGDGGRLDVEIEYSLEKEPLGTGGAIKNASDILVKEDKFLLVNGDIITNINIFTMIEALDEEYIGILSTVPLQSPYGIIDFDSEGRIIRFREKPILEDRWINAGIYLLRNEILGYLPDRGDIEKTTFPELAKMGKLKVVKYMGVFWRSIDSIKDIEYVSKMMKTFEDIVRG
jgi:NDP-sugar pyrophosphorylase family protein